jgi:hypothetical protein
MNEEIFKKRSASSTAAVNVLSILWHVGKIFTDDDKIS